MVCPKAVHTVFSPDDWHEHDVPQCPSLRATMSFEYLPHTVPHSLLLWQVVMYMEEAEGKTASAAAAKRKVEAFMVLSCVGAVLCWAGEV
jgi:hypothetical protein